MILFWLPAKKILHIVKKISLHAFWRFSRRDEFDATPPASASFVIPICFAAWIALVGVHHIEGHIAANYIEHEDLEPPFLCLVVSGGHTHLVKVLDYDKASLITWFIFSICFLDAISGTTPPYSLENNTEDGKEYAKIKVTIILNMESSRVSTDEEYILRKDGEGYWKIMGWQVVKNKEAENEGEAK